MQTLKERLREVMSAKEWEQADLMRVSGESSSVVSQWLGKGSKEIKSIGKMEAAERIEAASGFAALWVAKGLGPKFEARPAETRVAHGVSEPRPTMRLQRLAWGDLMDADLSQPFELDVTDDALGPNIYPGCVARFDPGAKPRPGRPVLVRDASGAHYLRDYEQGAAGRWRAVARRPGYAPLDSIEHGLELVAVMRAVSPPAWTTTRRSTYGASRRRLIRLSTCCAGLLASFTLLAFAAERSAAVRAEFRKLHPCPATGKKTGACPGWQIDHREALVCGGRDELANLQWLRTDEHREKTRAEVKLCRTNKHTKGKS